MGNATRGAGDGNRGGIRFGIRWDDGQRPKRLLLSLVAVCAALAPVAGAEARPAPVPAAVDVVVSPHPAAWTPPSF